MKKYIASLFVVIFSTVIFLSHAKADSAPEITCVPEKHCDDKGKCYDCVKCCGPKGCSIVCG